MVQNTPTRSAWTCVARKIASVRGQSECARMIAERMCVNDTKEKAGKEKTAQANNDETLNESSESDSW